MLVAIDVGSHKVCTLIGEGLPGGNVRVLGMGHAPAVGIRRGEVVHVDDAAGAIAASVERAERAAGESVHGAWVGITGLHLEGSNNQGVLPCGRRPRPINPADVERVLEVAGTVPLPPDREVLHVLPRHFAVDEGGPVDSPVNMDGYRLAAAVHIVTAGAAPLANLRRCLALAEVVPTGLVSSPLAAAEATLTADERQLGAFVVDLGASVTGLVCYVKGELAHSSVLAVGGQHLTNDLGLVLQTPLSEAEHIKITRGHVLPEVENDASEIAVVPFGEDQRRTVTRHHVSEVLAARADEIAELVMAELERAALTPHLQAGAVLVGGGTEMEGLPRRLAARWGVPVRVGRPTGVIGLTEAARGPSHAGVIGLLLWASRGVRDAAFPAPPRPEARGGLTRVWAWAREAFLPGDHARAWEGGG